MAASPAHTLTMEKHHTLSPTQEKQDKLNITLLETQQTQHIQGVQKFVPIVYITFFAKHLMLL